MYIVVTSKNQNPCDFVSNFIESININDGYEIALVGIYHGPLYNIDAVHNKFTLVKGTEVVDYEIPPGFYESTIHLLFAIQKALEESLEEPRSICRTKPIIKHEALTGAFSLNIVDKDVKFLVDRARSGESDILQNFGYYLTQSYSKIKSRFKSLGTSTEPTFIYSNIVAESVVDGHQSRLLACAPLKTEHGYCYHEFTNPLYHPLRVNSFTDISFQLRDNKGDLIQIAHQEITNKWGHFDVLESYPTVMILHVRNAIKG